jgi:hypothetical protein
LFQRTKATAIAGQYLATIAADQICAAGRSQAVTAIAAIADVIIVVIAFVAQEGNLGCN